MGSGVGPCPVDAGSALLTTRNAVAKAKRRVGAETSKTRTLLLNAAERLMREEGYAAVTSRNVAGKANVTAQLVHYYFSTMDDLFLALWRRFVGQNMTQQARALASSEPLKALWKFTYNVTGTALELEFMALANHRKVIRNELARDGDRFRAVEVEVLSQVMKDYGLDGDEHFAEVVTVLLSSVSRSLIMEKGLGVTVGHARTAAYVEQWLNRLEDLRTRRLTTRKKAR
jgi:TetR/AcrR family transcriptional regulator